MERDRRSIVGAFYVDAPLVPRTTAALSEHAAHHARVKRISEGDAVRLTNGAGTIGTGVIQRLRSRSVDVAVDGVEFVRRPAAIHARVPIGDRDRMLWLAEKLAEFGIDSWQAVRFRRSMSVSPRGEGAAFGGKVRARMVSALEQSGGAWLPEVLPETTVEGLAVADDTLPVLLDPTGSPMADVIGAAGARVATAVIFGPEGGFEGDEVARLVEAGWKPASLGRTTLRFETAGVAAVAVIRALGRETAR